MSHVTCCLRRAVASRAIATPAVERWHACQLEPPVLPVTVAVLIIIAPYNVGCHEHNRLTLRSVERTLEKRYRHPRVATPWHTIDQLGLHPHQHAVLLRVIQLERAPHRRFERGWVGANVDHIFDGKLWSRAQQVANVCANGGRTSRRSDRALEFAAQALVGDCCCCCP
eukprot:scaffold54912_cov63-Phaeocystis_antarctica.AAC.3